MKLISLLRCYLLMGVLVISVTGCAMDPSNTGYDSEINLPVIPGEATLEVSKTRTALLKIPDSMQLSTGNILMFSPIEFSNKKNHFNIEAAALPLGRYVAVRHSGEGITSDLPHDEARSFDLHYDAHYPDMRAAERDFPGLAPKRYRRMQVAGKTMIEIEQWHLRLSMIFSKERRAFRVLLDRLDYTAPHRQSGADSEPASQDAPQGLPVVVAFSYRHPDSVRETLTQQNIFFEFKVANHNGRFHGESQVSGWVPLPNHAQSVPYTVGIVVAEVHEKREDFYKKLFNMIKNVRGLI